MEALPKIIGIVGTNASGKSGLGVELAKRYGGEIVSADSRQVFQGLDLGSGKITEAEMQGVPHHLLNICQPGEFFSMADFQRKAYEAIDGILQRGKLPFLVGGTGLYVEAVVEGYLLSNKMPDLSYREELERLDTEELYRMLLKAVPHTQVEPRNRNRVMRVLERLHDGDDQPAQRKKRYKTLRLGVTWEKEALWQRIEERLSRRLEEGMIGEVQGLLDAGVSESFLRGLGLEYRFITQYLAGEIADRKKMVDLLGIAIRQFAKRQMTWFRRDPEIHWLNMAENPVKEAQDAINVFLETGSGQ